jgi:isopentenyl-diphosphate delta-isomerase type 1
MHPAGAPNQSESQEIFDIVNEHDEVIGQQPRSEVHRLGLRHRAVHVLVFNRQAQVFLQKRSVHKDSAPGAWDSSASGHLDAGETYDHAARREVKEELGVDLIESLQRLFKIVAGPETGHEFVWVYRTHHEGPFQLAPKEIETGAWFDASQVTRWTEDKPKDFAAAFRAIWRQKDEILPGSLQP